MTNHSLLQPGSFYHIYNRANGKENLFRAEADHHKFLKLYSKYISPVAETFAWVLMSNHFHSLVKIKEGMYYKYSKEDFNPSASPNADGSSSRGAGADAVGFGAVKWETVNPSASADSGPDGVNRSDGVNRRKKANPTNHFSHLFNAYAKYINEKYNRHGSLFQRPFRRKPVDDENYLRRVVIYIHKNPVHHGFVNHLSEYAWSSYHSCLSSGPTNVQREAVLDWFGGIHNFIEVHGDRFDHALFEAWLEDEAGDHWLQNNPSPTIFTCEQVASSPIDARHDGD